MFDNQLKELRFSAWVSFITYIRNARLLLQYDLRVTSNPCTERSR